MTITEAVELVDSMRPNAYSRQDKLRWLSELDGKVYSEVFLTHEYNPGETEPGQFAGYDDQTEGSTQLLIPAPYGGDVYNFYLQTMIDLSNAETVRYNQSLRLYLSAYAQFADHYNRTHRPRGAGAFSY